MRASTLKGLLLMRIRGSIVFSLGTLTATIIACTPQAHIPGDASLQVEKHHYNDIAYNLLSEIMGRVTGTPYDDIVELVQPQPIKLKLHFSSVQLGGDSGEKKALKAGAANCRESALLSDVTDPAGLGAMHLYAYTRLQN